MAFSNKHNTFLHLPGGNSFDDIRIDIAAAHKHIDDRPIQHRECARPRWKNALSLFWHRILRKLKLHHLLISNGVCDDWLQDFKKYWADELDGRPIWNPLDFFHLLYDYRKRQQFTTDLEWDDASKHLQNWQHPNQIYSTLHHVERMASNPFVHPPFWRFLPPQGSVLEYGCSSAPYYNCYRKFFSHRRCSWTLVDLPNFPFHYAKYLYRNDKGLDIITIDEKNFDDPLASDTREFDIIILTTVLEHLDDPVRVVQSLLKRLKVGGVFLFDFVKSEGTGLDHPVSLAKRKECLSLILESVEVLDGTLGDLDDSIPLIVSRKKKVLE